MVFKSFVQRLRDENVGPKDRMIILNIGSGCIIRYIGPFTLAHAEYAKSMLDYTQDKKQEAAELHYQEWLVRYADEITKFKALPKEEQEELIAARRQPMKPFKSSRITATIIELERPRQACDPLVIDGGSLDHVVFKKDT